MRQLCLTGLFLIFLSGASVAQDLGAYEEVTAGNFSGIGARQMAMGGAGIASSWDGAAMYYNPAALARIYRIEFQLGLNHQKFSNETTQPSGRYTGFTSTRNMAGIDMTKTRLGSLNLSLPVPTYRGSAVVAFGINRVMSFDRTSLFNVIDVDQFGDRLEDYAKEFETGSIYLYTIAGAMDVSPHVSLGAAVNIYSGDDNFTYNYYYDDMVINYYEQIQRRIVEDYFGASIKGGVFVHPSAAFSFGMTVEIPTSFSVDYTYHDEFYADSAGDAYADDANFKIEYDLKRPISFGAGIALRFSTFTIAGDAEYQDWSQLAYGDNPDMEIDNDILSMIYRDVVNLRGGIEYQIPSQGLALRGGLFSQPLPYNDKYIDSNRWGYTFGFGWLIDKVIMFEAAYVHGDFSRYYSPSNAEFVSDPTTAVATADDSFSRIYVTMSYRY